MEELKQPFQGTYSDDICMIFLVYDWRLYNHLSNIQKKRKPLTHHKKPDPFMKDIHEVLAGSFYSQAVLSVPEIGFEPTEQLGIVSQSIR
jgi:hypothetical protein